VEEITFETGSQLGELDFGLLSVCESLNSICIPASVEVIRSSFGEDGDLTFRYSPLETVTFEAGSRLREIRNCPFFHCDSLKAICLPASVQSMDARSFLFSSLREICIESGNPFFRVTGPFLVDLEGVRIVRYFGSGSEVVTIANEIEILSSSSFAFALISTIRFESMSKLSLIEDETFYFCDQLQSITIPSSVTILGKRCFYNCCLLQILSFEPGSQLITLGDSTFMNCFALKSIVLPSKVEIISGA
jgi:hypothetical protein